MLVPKFMRVQLYSLPLSLEHRVLTCVSVSKVATNFSTSLNAVTNVHLKVSCQTQLGDRVIVTGSIPALGNWDPRQGVEMKTAAADYPVWHAAVEAPTGASAVEYKYVIIRDSACIWESEIANRMFTAEGAVLHLDDGHFNVEAVKLLDKDFKLSNELERLRAIKNKKIAKIEAFDASKPGTGDTIFVITERLPLTVTINKQTGALSYEWLSFAADTASRSFDPSEESGDGRTEVVRVVRSASRHAGYVVENLRELRAQCRVIFIGGLGVDVPHNRQEAIAEELWTTMQCIPVFLEPEVRAEYEDFCHSVLKPVFHFVHPTTREMQRAFSAEDKWHQYVSVNREYVKPVLQHFNDGDLLMVFDYGLMMAPSLVGARARTANIGFFFNTPFPSSEIFRAIPKRKEALRSLLNADMICFHCFTYARHFLSCCSSLLGLEHRPAKCGMIALNFNGHHVGVRACHVGIDAETIVRRLHEPQLLLQKEVWANKLRDMQRHVVLVGYDDMEPLSGITLKLRAFRAMLRIFPEFRESAVLLQVAIPLHDARGMLAYPEYVDEVEELAADINLKYPGAVVIRKQKMAFTDRVALFSNADILVNCAVRHGLSLVPFEFVLSRLAGAPPGTDFSAGTDSRGGMRGRGTADGVETLGANGAAKMGTLILSEFTACSHVIPGALRTNPWREEECARVFMKSLRQPAHERAHWQQHQLAWCRHNTVFRWAENILTDMKMCRATLLENGEDVARTSCVRVGLVKSSYKEMSSNILHPAVVNSAYNLSKTRLLLLDLDLLMPPKGGSGVNVQEDMPSFGVEHSSNWTEFLANLAQLVKEPGNMVFLLSSDSLQGVLDCLKPFKAVEKLGLAAEDGYYYKWPGSPTDRWDQRQQVKAHWKEVCALLMHTYKERTTGSWVDEDQVASITWYYGDSNLEFGNLQAKELLSQLKETLEHLPVEVVLGKCFVRVRHQGVTKGSLVAHIIQHHSSRGGADFVLCLGDDSMDEDLFNNVREYQNRAHAVQSGAGKQQEVKVFTCTVGRQPAGPAQYCLYTLEDVTNLIGGLSLVAKKKMRSATMLDLSKM